MWKSHFFSPFGKTQAVSRSRSVSVFVELQYHSGSVLQFTCVYSKITNYSKLMSYYSVWVITTSSQWQKETTCFFSPHLMSLQYLDNVFRKIFKIKVAKLQNFFEPWSQIQVPEGREGFSDRLCKTLKLLQNIRNVMETAGKFWKIWFLLF